MESRAAVSSSRGIVTGFSQVTRTLPMTKLPWTSVICKTQVRTLAVSMIPRVRKVVELYGHEFSKCTWLVAPLDLQFL